MAFAEGSANDWLPLTMTDGFHVTHAQGTAVYGVFLTAMLIARIFGGAFLTGTDACPFFVSAPPSVSSDFPL
ncbi:hypothetical protein QNN00_00285 [Bacillus velezensis]|nr:hypothetical protein [Bacillus velezensis]